MGYLDNVNWEKIKKELQNELEKGLAVIKNGVIVIQKKAEELTEEGKRQYKILTTKAKIHDAMRDLGAQVYMLMSGARIKNPALNAAVKNITARIKGLETELAKLEGKADASSAGVVSQPRVAAHAKARRKAGATPRPRASRRVKMSSK
jgi:tetrahydromethanopterin S-methyltransferase subunit A